MSWKGAVTLASSDLRPDGVEVVLRGRGGGDSAGPRPAVAGEGQIGEVLDHQDLLRRAAGVRLCRRALLRLEGDYGGPQVLRFDMALMPFV